MYAKISLALRGQEKKPLFYYEGKTVTRGEFLRHVDIFAAYFSSVGIKQGSVVAMNLPNTVNAAVIFYAVNKLGATVNSLHPLLPLFQVKKLFELTKTEFFVTADFFYEKNEEELSDVKIPIMLSKISDYLPVVKKFFYAKAHEKPKNSKLLYYSDIQKNRSAVFAFRQGARELRGAHTEAYVTQGGAERDTASTQKTHSSPAVYLHSSGTTGAAKTVALSNLAFNCLSDALSPVIADADKSRHNCLMVLPLFHGFGLGVTLHTMLAHGAAVTVVPKFNALRTSKQIAKRKCTICAGVPIMYEKLMGLSDAKFARLRTLEHIFVGGETLDGELKEQFDARLKKIGAAAELLEGYGLTETVTVASVCKEGDFDSHAVGYPLDGIKIEIIDDGGAVLAPYRKGEICIAGGTLMDGYLGDTAPDWKIILGGEVYVRTGDIGYLNDKGKLFFSERRKSVFKVSGVNVFPSDIELAVKEARLAKNCVAAMRNGEVVLFVETPACNHSDDYKQKILDACKEKVIPYAMPKEIRFFESFPRNAIGKVSCQELLNADGVK